MSRILTHSGLRGASFGLAACFGLTLLASSGALANENVPPRENLDRAKQSVVAAQAMVQELVDRVNGGGNDDGGHDDGGGSDDPGSRSCSQINRRDQCVRAGCRWLQDGEFGQCTDQIINGGVVTRNLDSGDVDENDHAAGWALQGLGSGLFQLGQLVDQMNASYGTWDFFNYWHQACHKTVSLLQGTQAGRTAANLPLAGFIRPYDFDPIEDELYAVRQDLWCQ
jgi:hypothetical protein